MERSPESELIDLLTEDDERLPVIKSMFAGNIEHAQRVTLLYLSRGIIAVYCDIESDDRVLGFREAKGVLENPANWELNEQGGPDYYVSITDRALNALHSGPDAWERLFNRSRASTEQ